MRGVFEFPVRGSPDIEWNLDCLRYVECQMHHPGLGLIPVSTTLPSSCSPKARPQAVHQMLAKESMPSGNSKDFLSIYLLLNLFSLEVKTLLVGHS